MQENIFDYENKLTTVSSFAPSIYVYFLKGYCLWEQ